MRLFFLGVIFLMTSNVFAGWYECYTYTGQIAGANVHVYLQIREINATFKDTLPVSGLYRYDKFNEPIALTGTLVKNKTLELTEYHGTRPFATLTFQWNKGSLDGVWQSEKKSYKITLTKVASLVDKQREMINEPTEILLASSFKNDYLVGLYYKGDDDYRARMSELRIIDKKTNKIKYTIKFDSEDRPVGNVMTIIFANVSTWEDTNTGNKSLEIEEDDGRMGQSFTMTYDKKTERFLKNAGGN